jgi:hypothetical protein
VAHKYGIIKKIELHLSNETKGEALEVHLNNADNNEVVPSSNALRVRGADLLISKDIRGAKIIGILAETVSQSLGAGKIGIPDWLKDFALDWIDDKMTPPTSATNVSTHVLVHLLSDKSLSEYSFSELFFDKPCTIETGASVAAEFPVWGISNWVPIVPDQGTELNSTYVGSCRVKIAQEFRMTVENDVFSTLRLRVTRYPKITISKDDEIETIEYSHPSYFGNSSCSSSSCKEYFDRNVDLLNLVATNHATYWNGYGTDKCPDRVSCFVQLDGSNYNPPDVAAHSYSGTWNTDVTDDETGCEEGINSYDLSAIITVNGNELSINVRPVSWSGPLLPNPNSISYNVAFSEDGGTTSEHGSVNFNKGTFTGSSSWSWSDGSDSCSGTSTFSGSKL